MTDHAKPMMALAAVRTLEPIVFDLSLSGQGLGWNYSLLTERASGARLAQEAVTAVDRRQSVKFDAVPNGSAAAASFEAHAAFCRCLRPSSSAICTALSAAPLRRLSLTTHRLRPFSTVGSSRIRLT